MFGSLKCLGFVQKPDFTLKNLLDKGHILEAAEQQVALTEVKPKPEGDNTSINAVSTLIPYATASPLTPSSINTVRTPNPVPKQNCR